ncbi:hypothetical protein BGY98DRAFT_976318 [Russula aff. rugulosa BPL654]|nr:hypothetical protein BGY98DRAFT_976318 [Russula aff. rugulosa BPL654]
MSILYDYPTLENEHDETITQIHAFIDRMTRISQHHSSGSSMSKASIRGNLTGFVADIAAVKQTGLTYVLGETNSFRCHGAPGVSNTAGAALWAWITLCLQASSALLGYISIKASVINSAHNTDEFLDGSTLLQPLPPHIPLYYAAIIATQLIGSSGSTTIVELTVDNTQISTYSSI